MILGEYEIGLQALLEQDLTSYEYFCSLSDDLKKKIEVKDISSFKEMQEFVKSQSSK